MTVQQQFLLLSAVSCWILVSTAIRVWRRRARASAVQMDMVELDPLRLIPQLAGAVCLALGLLLGAGMFLRGEALLGARLVALSILVSGVADVATECLWPLPKSKWDLIPLVTALALLVVGTGVLGMALYLRSVPGPNREALQVEWPFRGRWRVETGGRSPRTNYHHGRAEVLRCAVDFVVDGPRGASLGEPVLAPIAGLVTEAVGDRWQGDEPSAGNVVEIEVTGGVVVRLAHLQRNSVLVAAGDRVSVGQQIGSCGESGSAAFAHLHIHAERGGQPVPIVFGGDRAFPVRNDVIQGGL